MESTDLCFVQRWNHAANGIDGVVTPWVEMEKPPLRTDASAYGKATENAGEARPGRSFWEQNWNYKNFAALAGDPLERFHILTVPADLAKRISPAKMLAILNHPDQHMVEDLKWVSVHTCSRATLDALPARKPAAPCAAA